MEKYRRSSMFAGLFGAVTALLAPIGPLHAQSAEDFFKKTNRITLYVGSGAGGGFDQTARLVAANLSRFLPNHPSIVIENMPGAGGVEANNFVYNSVPRDGSVILAGGSLALALPIYGAPAARYDPRKFEWIGSTSKNQGVCVTWKSSQIKTLEDARNDVVTVGATAVTDGMGVYPTILNALLGTKFKVVTGYSTGNAMLAVERGEVEGLCGYSWQAYQAIGSKWFSDGKVNILVQLGLDKIAELPDVPKADDLMQNPDDREVIHMIASPDEFGRPFLAPPGTPEDRVAMYRRAFQTMLRDSQFLNQARQQRMSIDPLDDKQIEALLARDYALPKNIRDRAAAFVMPHS